MNKLPTTVTRVENSMGTSQSVITKQDASDKLDSILDRAHELETVMTAIQPLLHALSERLYGADDQPIPLSKLIEDSINLLKETS